VLPETDIFEKLYALRGDADGPSAWRIDLKPSAAPQSCRMPAWFQSTFSLMRCQNQ